ncbi:hypothetical protein [Planococcus dechangensis]|uniref:DUF2922 domain-containing protein n=1 Tax=Planococcus dechangensis TaxID=1176255 RepID=A0ABV9M8V9_9BACL
MKMKYELTYKSGQKEKVIQEATEQQHTKIIQLVSDAFQNDSTAVITFGEGKGIGKYVRVSDLSQVVTEILE